MASTFTNRIDGLSTSVAVKAPCRVAATTNITLSGLQTIDSITVVSGDRILVKDQTNQIENGIYDASTSEWQRSADFDGNRDIVNGTLVWDLNGGIFFQVTTGNPITIGTSSIVFAIASSLSLSGLTSVISIAAMKALSSSSVGVGQSVQVTEAGRGGSFIVRAGSLADNSGTLFEFDDQPASPGNTLYLERTGVDTSIPVLWFGAAVDGVTDDTLAFQAAIDYGNSLFLGGSIGGGGVEVFLPKGRMLYTGVVIKTGVNIIGAGNSKSVLLLSGDTATGLKCLAADTQSSGDGVFHGRFQGFGMFSADVTPTSQTQWNMTGFSRWETQDIFIEWFGGCNGIDVTGATLAGSGGPAQWYNTFIHCFLIRPASRPTGGIAGIFGDTDGGFEQVTAMTWLGGRISGSGGGTGFTIRGTGNRFFGVTFEGLDTAVSLGSSGTRGSLVNYFSGCYWEGNTTNRDMLANATGSQFVGSFVTGGVDSDLGISTLFDDNGIHQGFSGNLGAQKWEVIVANGATRRPVFKGLNTVPAIAIENSAGTQFILANGAATSSASKYVRFFDTSFTLALLEIGTVDITAGADGLVNLGSASNKFNTVYAAVGTINTSDEDEKSPLEELDDIEKACALECKGLIRKFKFKEAIESKGEESARIHIGVGAQSVRDVFLSHGLDPYKYALFCYDEWEEETEVFPGDYDDDGNEITPPREVVRPAGSRYGIRYDELMAFIISAM